jgi:hypothetical protein
MPVRWLLIWLGLIAPAIPASAGGLPNFHKPTASEILPLLAASSTDALAGSIRGYLVRTMPTPLYESRINWGHTAEIARGLKWDGLRPEVQRSAKNDGKWRHITVTALNPADTLIFDIRDLQNPEPGRITFTVFLSLDAGIDYEQQNWERGRRLYSGSARARFRVRSTLNCEMTFRLDSGALLLPEAVVRLRVVQANVSYDNFKTEHVAGIGGEAAEVLGAAIRGGLKRWDPSLEQNLLAKANAAIEKSADTKEVRLSLSRLLGKWDAKPKPVPALAPPAPVDPPPETADP